MYNFINFVPIIICFIARKEDERDHEQERKNYPAMKTFNSIVIPTATPARSPICQKEKEEKNGKNLTFFFFSFISENWN